MKITGLISLFYLAKEYNDKNNYRNKLKMNELIDDNNLKIYWKWLVYLFLAVIIFNLIFHNYINIVSFTNLFLIIIPNWFFALWFHRNQTQETEKLLKNYMEKNYPEKLKDFYERYHSDTNPGTKPIFVLFMDKKLLNDQNINKLKNKSNKAIMLFVCLSAITIMVFLISTVFIMKVMYFS